MFWTGSHGDCFQQVKWRTSWDDLCETEALLGEQRSVLTHRTLLPPGHDEHVQIEQLGGRGMIIVGNRHLDHQQFSLCSHGGATVVQNLRRFRILPIDQYELEHVEIPTWRHSLKEIATNSFATFLMTLGMYCLTCCFYDLWAIEHSSAHVWICVQNGQQQIAMCS